MRMNEGCRYLFRTRAALDEFRRRYATFIASEADRYAEWVNGFPLMEWVEYLNGVPKENVPVLVGMLCHLYDAGRINICFHPTLPVIRRDPMSLAEWNAWCEALEPLKIPKKRTNK